MLAWISARIHLKMFVFLTKIVIVSIFVSFQITTVSRILLVALARGKVHVFRTTISSTLALASSFGIFCILIKTEDR